MKRSSKEARGGMGALVAAAAAATVAGHELAYRLAYFGSHDRHRALAQTGHAYWPGAVRAAIVLALVGLILQIARGKMAAHAAPPSLARLVPIQLGMFAAMEIIERLTEHASPLALLTEPAFWVGIPAQLVVALVVTLILRAARRAGQVLGRLFFQRPRADRERTWRLPEAGPLFSSPHGSSWRTRAPPRARASA